MDWRSRLKRPQTVIPPIIFDKKIEKALRIKFLPLLMESQ